MTKGRESGRKMQSILMVNMGEARPVLTETSPRLSAGTEPHATPFSIESEETPVDDFKHLPKWRRPSVYWLIAPFTLFMLAFGGVMVPKINLTVDLICRRYLADQAILDPSFTSDPVIVGGENPQCFVPEVQQKVATFTLVISMMTGILSAFAVPMLGSLSDRYGRTRLLVIVSSGGIINEIIAILTARFPNTVDFRWLILGAFFDGLTGSFTAGTVLTNSYTSDCTPPSKRAVHIGYLHACMFSGMAFGPLLAGYFVKFTGSFLSMFYLTLGCHILFVLFIWFITPESLSRERQVLAWEQYHSEREAYNRTIQLQLLGSSRKAKSYKLFKALRMSVEVSSIRILLLHTFGTLKILFPTGRGKAPVRRNIIILALVNLVVMSVAMASGMVTILYVEAVFQWGTFESSRYVSLMSLVRALSLLAVFPIINYIFRRQRGAVDEKGEKNTGADDIDLWLMRAALLSECLGAVGYTISRSSELFVLSGVMASFGGIGGPIIQSTLTKHVPAGRVGSLLGALGLLESLGRVFAPMLFNGIYAATVGSVPQAFFLLLSIIFALALVGSLFVRPHLFLQDEYGLVPESDLDD